MTSPFYRLKPTAREAAMISFALARTAALNALATARENAARGYDTALARKFARECGAEARAAWRVLA